MFFSPSLILLSVLAQLHFANGSGDYFVVGYLGQYTTLIIGFFIPVRAPLHVQPRESQEGSYDLLGHVSTAKGE
jgi:hypothetical protein